MSNYQINKLTPNIGAEIIGKDIFDNLTKTVCDKIYETLIEHKVIFFRNQEITNEQHIKFAKSFGEIEPPETIIFIASSAFISISITSSLEM